MKKIVKPPKTALKRPKSVSKAKPKPSTKKSPPVVKAEPPKSWSIDRAHEWTHDVGEVRILKCVEPDGSSHGGFKWPLEVGAVHWRDVVVYDEAPPEVEPPKPPVDAAPAAPDSDEPKVVVLDQFRKK